MNFPRRSWIPIVIIIIPMIPIRIIMMHEPFSMMTSIFTPVRMMMPVADFFPLVAMIVIVGACIWFYMMVSLT
jgi:hypothetical protein